MFFQQYAGKQHRDRGIQGRDDNSFVQTPRLTRANEQYRAERVDTASQQAPPAPGGSDVAEVSLQQDDYTRDEQASSSGERRDPERGTVAGLPDAQIEACKPCAGKQCEPNPFRSVSMLRARDQPEPDRGQEKSDDRNFSRQAFCEHTENSWNRGAEHRSH